ncbi:MAG: 3-hydroxyacyl-CoA dehydrogenase NAD-binding domain-containing protein [Saprospiraceae bacterium]|nr:3-hydroxyacyl-CoA dehydrogenase NAD-binding domain-containing protein [Saprospiraceae bacterium]
MIRYKKDIDNIITLTLDMEGRNINIINHKIGAQFTPVMQHLKDEKARGSLRGIIITSAKNNFLAGGDLDYLHEVTDPEAIFDFSQNMQKFFRDLESPGVPVVAAINGSALGTGFELALACHYRVAIDNPKIRLGHPEVTLGIMPGGGGVIRMLWTLGVEKAYHVLADGKRFLPKEALEAGIVDVLAKDEKEMLYIAKQWLLENQEGRRTWDTNNGKIPGGRAKNNELGQRISLLTAQLMRDTENNYPAPAAILNTLTEGSLVDFDTACRIESRYFTELVKSREAKNMIKAFWYDFNAIKEGSSRPKGYGKFRVKKVGIIGAGLMGSSVAFICLMNRMEVVLKDISKAVAEKGKDLCQQKLNRMVEKGKLTSLQVPKILKKINTTDNAAKFKDCDIIIEAVFENQNVKANVTREAEMHLDEYSIFATNTISIPITKLATASARPENFVGLHFFAPADEVPLVEVVRGKRTSNEAIAKAFDFIKAIRKIPIVVKDNWGFFAARVQNTFILEGITLLQEGYAPALIENLSLQAGMPKGALALADNLSLNIVLQYENQAAEIYGSKYIRHPAVDVLLKMIKDLNRQGKKMRAGFYDYQKDSQQLWQELDNHFPSHSNSVAKHEIIERLLFVQVIEAFWCLQEGIIKTEEEGNLGSIFGWGFPAFKGGVYQFVTDYGINDFIKKCELLEKKLGPRFQVPKRLRKMALMEVGQV